MTSDGTNAYAWDAENRLVKITFPGSGNNSQFVYDPLGRNVKIEERSGGSLTSVKQFVWCRSQRCEEREDDGDLSKRFFDRGQMNGSTAYLYTKDHLGSVREMTDNSGVVQARYSFDPFGRVTKLQGTADSDFQFAGMYAHARSGLGLTRTRAYSPTLSRWISRDPLAERGEPNPYAYAMNSPTMYVDPEGTFAQVLILGGGAAGTVIIIVGSSILIVTAANYTGTRLAELVRDLINQMSDKDKPDEGSKVEPKEKPTENVEEGTFEIPNTLRGRYCRKLCTDRGFCGKAWWDCVKKCLKGEDPGDPPPKITRIK
jgi:RHS repeat-associated protein